MFAFVPVLPALVPHTERELSVCVVPAKRSSGDDDPWDPENLGFTLVGTVLGPHGLRGEAKVRSDSDFARERLASNTRSGKPTQRGHFLRLAGRRYPRPVAVSGARKASQRGTWIVKVGGWDTPEQVKAGRGAQLYVRDQDRPRGLGASEFLVKELVGMRVVHVEDDGGELGVVSGVITTDELPGAGSTRLGSDILEITLCGESEDGGDEDTAVKVLVPFVPEIVPVVDVEAGLLHLTPPEGLLKATTVPKPKARRGPRGLLMPARD